MSRTLHGYLGATTEVVHARDLGLQTRSDPEWIKYLHATGDAWTVVTGDARIFKNRAEREAFRRAGLRGVVLAAAYPKTPMGRCCGIIIAKWDDMIEFTRQIEPPFLVEMSINLNSGFRILPL